MSQATDLTPWLAVAGLGAFHGLNPAMGWLFAVALGLHRRNRTIVFLSLVPILLGHAVSVGLALYAAIALGFIIEASSLFKLGGIILIGWAVWHLVYGHRHRVRVGMQTGLVGLFFWSFLVATAHGAGLMLLPIALPLCLAAGPGSELTASGSIIAGVAVVAVHTAAMLLVIAAIAFAVYEWIGVAFLRRGWINVDLLWSAALAVAGIAMLFL